MINNRTSALERMSSIKEENAANITTLTRRGFLKVSSALTISALLPSIFKKAASKAHAASTNPTKSGNLKATNIISAESFPHLYELEGLSDELLKEHLGLYTGYVNTFNQCNQKIASITEKLVLNKTEPLEKTLRDLHLQRAYAHNGLLLHEYYFSNLSPQTNTISNTMKKNIEEAFGGWQHFQAGLDSLAKSYRGWVILGHCSRSNSLSLYGLDGHSTDSPVMPVVPLLVIDVYEHAYMRDYGTNKNNYLKVCYEQINWELVEQRFLACFD